LFHADVEKPVAKPGFKECWGDRCLHM